jgi:D-3-phosphoglycerate dehydrogenase / 2-oxoglutarate reductase
VRRADTLAECIKTADFISLHIPLLEATRNIINTEVLNNCKNGAVLLNFARSELVDSAAISSALNSKKIAFYACDFPSSSWQDNPQVISFPHLGASTNQATSNCAVMAAKQIISFLEHGSIINSVNFPQLHLDPVKIARITIANDNIPSMVSQISNCLSANNLNISALYNRSRGDIAYTAIDLEHAIDAATIQQIRTIPGIRNLRYLEAEQCD